MKAQIAEILAALSAGEVRYLVVGGVAVVLHGHLRTTLDLDLVVQLEPDNVGRAFRVFEKLGLEPLIPVPMRAFADSAARESWRRDKHTIVFSLGNPSQPTLKVGLFVFEPFDFDTVYDRSVSVDLETAEARVPMLEDLIALKRAAGRPQDLADIASLEALARAASGEEVPEVDCRKPSAAETPYQDFAWDPEAERLHQIKVALAMTPAQRLHWLETTVAELRPWVGLTRAGARSTEPPGSR